MCLNVGRTDSPVASDVSYQVPSTFTGVFCYLEVFWHHWLTCVCRSHCLEPFWGSEEEQRSPIQQLRDSSIPQCFTPFFVKPPVMCVPYLQHPGCEISYLDSCCPLCSVLDRGLCSPGGDTGDIWLTGGPWGTGLAADTDLGVTATLLLMGMCASQDRDEI